MNLFILHEFSHFLRMLILGNRNILPSTPEGLIIFDKEDIKTK